MRSTRLALVALFSLAAATGVAAAADADSDQFGDYKSVGFLSDYSQLKPEGGDSKAFIARYTGKDADKYDKLLIDRIKVYFKDADEAQGIDPTDLKALTDYFHAAIVKAMGDAYPVVTEPGPDVLRLRIAVTNLVPNNPAASVITLAVPFLWLADAGTGVAKGNTGSTAFVGEATIEMEVMDSASNKQLAAYIETRIGTKYNWVEGVKEGVTDYARAYSTWAYTRQAMDEWAKFLRARLDAAHDKTAAAAE